MYKEGNYQLTAVERFMGGDAESHQVTDLEKGIYEEESYPLYSDPWENKHKVCKIAIKRAF